LSSPLASHFPAPAGPSGEKKAGFHIQRFADFAVFIELEPPFAAEGEAHGGVAQSCPTAEIGLGPTRVFDIAPDSCGNVVHGEASSLVIFVYHKIGLTN